MKLFRISNVIYLSFTLALAGLLFWTSQMVQHAEDQRASLRDQLAAERNGTHVLEAEWHYLNRPQRLEQLAYDQLRMGPARVSEYVEDTDAIPEPALPVLPGFKPAFFVPDNKVQEPKKKKSLPRVNDRASFDSLVESLSKENEAAQ